MKVVLHLGFPKSCSSTLQFGLWAPLDYEQQIHLSTWRKIDAGEPLDLRPSSCLFNWQDIPQNYLNFQPNLLNILSDESFTAPKRLREHNFGKNIQDPRRFPQIIKRQIQAKYGNEVEIFPLVILRNHADLLFSQYVEEYNLKIFKGVEFIFDAGGQKIDLHDFEIYQFNSYIDEVLKVFGSRNTQILFFEQIEHDFDKFCSNIAEITQVNAEKVVHCFRENLINRRRRSQSGYWTKDNKYLIPYLTKQHRSDIVDYFAEDTKLLAERFRFNIDLKKWGYIF